MRIGIYSRDNYTCAYCKKQFTIDILTIDHVIPLSLGGLDEITNYVTACKGCNYDKSNLPLKDFAKRIQIDCTELPVHGDPVLLNAEIPIELRLIRKNIYDFFREKSKQTQTKSRQKQIEKKYRLELHQTTIGKDLKESFPSLPGPVRVIIPEIRTIAKNENEYQLLIELAKSATTRNLIGTVLVATCDIEDRTRELLSKTKDVKYRKRLADALKRFDKWKNH
ncbi:HNH endonuclease [Leptospira koniambonensis]|uniref:HNH endonuclease n=1 Tax=Leptospira koniambonensis TaxID=2484950 RepID=UPI003EBF38F7